MVRRDGGNSEREISVKKKLLSWIVEIQGHLAIMEDVGLQKNIKKNEIKIK